MLKVIEIAFSCYPVTDFVRARKFYEGVLGLKPTKVKTSRPTALGGIRHWPGYAFHRLRTRLETQPRRLLRGAGSGRFRRGHRASARERREVSDGTVSHVRLPHGIYFRSRRQHHLHPQTEQIVNRKSEIVNFTMSFLSNPRPRSSSRASPAASARGTRSSRLITARRSSPASPPAKAAKSSSTAAKRSPFSTRLPRR